LLQTKGNSSVTSGLSTVIISYGFWEVRTGEGPVGGSFRCGNGAEHSSRDRNNGLGTLVFVRFCGTSLVEHTINRLPQAYASSLPLQSGLAEGWWLGIGCSSQVIHRGSGRLRRSGRSLVFGCGAAKEFHREPPKFIFDSKHLFSCRTAQPRRRDGSTRSDDVT
jgi:hypothetical protein